MTAPFVWRVTVHVEKITNPGTLDATAEVIHHSDAEVAEPDVMRALLVLGAERHNQYATGEQQ